VQIVGVSFDPPEANAAFARKHRFPFPLLSDTERRLALAFGAATDPRAKYARRVSAIIDERGRLIRLYPAVNPRTHAEEVLRELESK
jgi:peroxiredoxin Q/BCP